MAILGSIGGPLLNLVKGIALKDAKRWANENLGRGPSALGPVSGDIDKITEEVYRYSATIRTAVTSLDLPRSTPSLENQFCTTSFGASEVQVARETITQLQTIRTRLSNAVEGAADRAQADSIAAAAAVREASSGLDDMAQRGDRAGARQFGLQSQQYTNAERLADTNMILVRRRGANLAATLDSLIAEMNANLDVLNAHWNDWIRADTECSEWQVHLLDAR